MFSVALIDIEWRYMIRILVVACILTWTVQMIMMMLFWFKRINVYNIAVFIKVCDFGLDSHRGRYCDLCCNLQSYFI